MTKDEAIKRINERLGTPALNDKNTHFAGIVVYGTDEGWWLKIPYLGFKKDLHIILNNEKGKTFQHLTIKGNTLLSPGMKFRSSDAAADAFIPSANPKRLVDALAGGSKYNFTRHVVDQYRH
jgi:hypothetical protein